jgi:hypothetical protein
MNDNDPYQTWLEKKRSFDVSNGFSKKIVDQIRRDQRATQRRNPKRLIGLWLDWISLRPLAQGATIASAAIAGLLRLVLILHVVFYSN